MKARSTVVVLLVLCCVCGAALVARASTEPGEAARPADRWVVRVDIDSRETLERITSWLEPWEVHLEEGYLIVDVSFDDHERLLAMGLRVELDDKRTAELQRPFERLPGQRAGIPGYPCYRTVEETLATGQSLASSYPQLAQWIDIGDSWERTQNPGAGYDLMVLRLTNTAIPGPKPRLWVEGGIHARELTTAELATRFAEHLLTGYGVDPDITWLLDFQEVMVLLQTNPDGRKKAEGGLSWRKNTNATTCGTTSYQGVDLNRNFSFQWACCGGSSSSGCDETYHGGSAGSEPETQAVQSALVSYFPDQRPPDQTTPAPDDAIGIFIDLHSYGEVFLSSWGYTSTAPPNGAQILRLARKLAYFPSYDAQLGSSYAVDGATKDFAYGELGLAAYTIEMGTAFFQSCSTFESTIYPEVLPALVYAAKAARAPYLLPAGPDALDVLAVPSVAAAGDTVTVTATLDDTRYVDSEPAQAIAQAELYIDTPPWEAGAVPVAMAAADGSFSSTIEAVTVDLDTTGQADGRHMLFVRGQDASGSWGPVSAAFLYILDPATAPRIAGTVVAAGTLTPLDATVAAGQLVTTTNPADGTYTLMVPEGTYDVTATATDHQPVTETGIVATTATTTTVSFQLPAFAAVLTDDVESGNLGWTADPPWAITDESSHSATHSWTDSPGGSYANSLDISLTSPILDLTGRAAVTLELWHEYELEAGWDYGRIEYSTDGGTSWTEAQAFDGTQAWQQLSLPLPALDDATTARIRFRLETDSSQVRNGWHIDDIALRATGDTQGSIFADGFESGDMTRWGSVSP